MNRVAASALFGIVCSAFVAGGAYAVFLRDNRVLGQLVVQCENSSSIAQAKPAFPGEPWNKDPLVCDPLVLVDLVDLKQEKPGIQREIAKAQSLILNPYPVYVAACLIAVLGFVPWAWYFFLRRLREVAAALTGK